jgi:hypothetical protein
MQKAAATQPCCQPFVSRYHRVEHASRISGRTISRAVGAVDQSYFPAFGRKTLDNMTPGKASPDDQCGFAGCRLTRQRGAKCPNKISRADAVACSAESAESAGFSLAHATRLTETSNPAAVIDAVIVF